MTLPTITQVTLDHTITLDDDLVVTFRLVPIPGSKFQRILDDHRDADGRSPNTAIAVDLITAGISEIYSSVESTPAVFTDADARELWETWPDWARWDVFSAVLTYATKGPAADPFVRSKPNGNDAG